MSGISEQAEAEAERRWPYEHVGYTSQPPKNCRCDECHDTYMKRLAYEDGYVDGAASLNPEPSTDVREALGDTLTNVAAVHGDETGTMVPLDRVRDAATTGGTSACSTSGDQGMATTSTRST